METDVYNKELIRFKELYKEEIKENRGLYMTEMERIFKIPMINDEEFNNKNKEVIKLYRNFANWLFD